jgi:hypothetical protein
MMITRAIIHAGLWILLSMNSLFLALSLTSDPYVELKPAQYKVEAIDGNGEDMRPRVFVKAIWWSPIPFGNAITANVILICVLIIVYSFQSLSRDAASPSEPTEGDLPNKKAPPRQPPQPR